MPVDPFEEPEVEDDLEGEELDPLTREIERLTELSRPPVKRGDIETEDGERYG